MALKYRPRDETLSVPVTLRDSVHLFDVERDGLDVPAGYVVRSSVEYDPPREEGEIPGRFLVVSDMRFGEAIRKGTESENPFIIFFFGKDGYWEKYSTFNRPRDTQTTRRSGAIDYNVEVSNSLEKGGPTSLTVANINKASDILSRACYLIRTGRGDSFSEKFSSKTHFP